MAQTLQPQYDTVTVINKEYAYGKYQTTIGSAALLQALLQFNIDSLDEWIMYIKNAWQD